MKRKRGFTLIELTTALFIFSTALLGTIQLYHVGLNKIKVVGESRHAMQAALNQVELIRSMPFSELTERQDAPFIGASDDLESLSQAQPTLTIRNHPDPALKLKEVTVSVRWTGEHGRTITMTITTLVGDNRRHGS